MKNTKLQVVTAAAFALALSPLVAHAQTSPAATTGETSTYNATTTDDRGMNREHYNYGWVGLLGLLGLTGLMRKRDGRVERYDTGAGRAEVRR